MANVLSCHRFLPRPCRSLTLLLPVVWLPVITALGAPIHYVDVNNPSPASPYSTWATAANEIQDAVDEAIAGDTVLVTNGTYATGGRAAVGLSLTNRVTIDKAITVSSVNGPDVTLIEGAWDPATNGLAAVRCVYMADGSSLSGFTLTNGATRASGDSGDRIGGGVFNLHTDSALVSNCIFTGNAAVGSGGGAYGVNLDSCFLSNNWSGFDGGGAWGGSAMGCTFANNHAVEGGGGSSSSILTDCLVTGNTAGTHGGGTWSGKLYSCTVANNSTLGVAGLLTWGGGGCGTPQLVSGCVISNNVSGAGDGGGIRDATLITNCLIVGNTASGWSGGGSAHADRIVNSVIAHNSAGHSGGVRGEEIVNCTVVSNTATGAGGIGGVNVDTLKNSIVYYNSAPNRPGTDNFVQGFADPGSVTYTCTTPFPTGGVAGAGVITNAPGFANLEFDNYRLLAASPCVDTGNNPDADGAVDLDGFPRIAGGTVDMGAYEFVPAGTSTTHFADLANVTPQWPYASWATAATSIQDAIDAADDGDTVLVTNGLYNAGGRTAPDEAHLSRVLVDRPIEVRSVNGPAVTIIEGAWDPVTTNGADAVRCVRFTAGGSLSGFTVTNGASRTGGGPDVAGGGISGQTAIPTPLVSNCLVVGNAAFNGGGAYSANFADCTLSNNWSAHNGGGAFNCNFTDCLLVDNSTPASGGGAYIASLTNCVLVGNSAGGSGGGSFASDHDRCTLLNNSADSFGGGTSENFNLKQQTHVNSLFAGNVSGSVGGGIQGGNVINCTVAGNTGTSGGGLFGCTVRNSIVYDNLGGASSNYSLSTFTFSCSAPKPSSTGNINVDPQFVDLAGGDYRLASNSPCINVAENAEAQGPLDLDGNPRFEYGIVDMGAYEFPFDPAWYPTNLIFAFGAEIPPVDRPTADPAMTPIIDPAGHAFYSPALDKVFGTDPGIVTITWKDSGGANLPPVPYLITSVPEVTPYRVYHTHSVASNTVSDPVDLNTPVVDLSPAAQSVIHWNTAFPTNPANPYLHRHGNDRLRAREKTGLIMIEHQTAGGLTLSNGIQVVEVLEPQPDPGVTSVAMGEILAPVTAPTSAVAQWVASGQLYQHSKAGDSFDGNLIVTQSRTDPTPIHVYWGSFDPLGILWPEEFRAYTVSDLALEPVAIYHTESTPAPDVALPSAGTFMDIRYNSLVDTNHLFKQVGDILQAQTVIGEVVVVYFTGADTNGTYLGREIVELRPYVPDVVQANVLMGDELQPFAQHAAHVTNATEVTRGLQLGRSDVNGFIYQHQDAGPYAGRCFAVKPTIGVVDAEIFWMRDGLFSEWPYEMRRYTCAWPVTGQRFVRRGPGEELPKIDIPMDLNPFLMPAQQFAIGQEGELVGDVFLTRGEGWSLLGFETGSPTAKDWVGFLPVQSTLRTDPVYSAPATNWTIGVEITEPTHEGPKSGHIYEPTGDRFEPSVYQAKDALGWTTGQIFAVNTGNIEVFWANEVAPRPGDAVNRIQFPSTVGTYTNDWPTNAPTAVIASQMGTGEITNHTWYLYVENDSGQPGYNPNDEHALVAGFAGGNAVFPLRNDLGTPATSEPFVLVPYQDEPGGPFGLHVWEVLAEDVGNTFTYAGNTAGKIIQPPFPLSTLPNATPPGTAAVSGPFFQDRKGAFWSKAAGDDGSPADIVMQFYYEVQPGFSFPDASPAEGTPMPWLTGTGTTGTPQDVTYTIEWPTNSPVLKAGETLFMAKNNIDNVADQTSVQILYQQTTEQAPGTSSVFLFDPIVTRNVPLTAAPSDLETLVDGALLTFSDFPPHLRDRLQYDPIGMKLQLQGEWVDAPGTEEPSGYLLVNALSDRDRDALKALSSDGPFHTALDDLAALPLVELGPETPAVSNAVSAGRASGTGFVTLAFGNSISNTPPGDPVVLTIFRVDCPQYRGELKTILSSNPFDEQMTLRHTGDFAGDADDYEFEWRTLPNSQSGGNTNYASWNFFALEDGALDITVKGANLFALTDNDFVCRYRDKTAPLCTTTNNPSGWSDWTAPQLAPGWIKRVITDVNLFDETVGPGATANTVVSMLEKAGTRWIGATPLNSAAADNFGLIQIYETVLRRGIALSIEGTPPIQSNDDVVTALMLAAGRLADLYMLLGHEAYADASDPTVALNGFSSAAQHAFMNQVAAPNLLLEELILLRGRDDFFLPSVFTHPFYNRLDANFTGAEGQAAYAANYNVIDVDDARTKYPQGHGDAWGHYLTAIKNYYRLLRNTNFTWIAQSETMLIGGVQVDVDFLDERKFAQAASSLAKTGAEVANLTYRQFYTEDPNLQWQGYADPDTNQAWGVSEWGSRAGQGAYLNWVAGNAMLPDVDTVNSGVERIDRTTVSELNDIVGGYQDIQRHMDQADAGLNPLGLAKNVVPFGIDPSLIDMGITHFEQIYDRAVDALNNAIAVFNYAQGASIALRQQSDSVTDFQHMVDDQRIDFRNRLVEIFGSPFPEDIGPGGAYPSGYDGPDLVHYQYFDEESLSGVAQPDTTTLTVTFTNYNADAEGVLTADVRNVDFNIAENRFHLVKPGNFTVRQSPGEIQRALSDLIQARLNFERALNDYNTTLAAIETQAQILQVQHNVNAEEIRLEDTKNDKLIGLNKEVIYQRQLQIGLTRAGQTASALADAFAEAIPTSVGTSTDWGSLGRGALKLTGALIQLGTGIAADVASIEELDYQQQKELFFFGGNSAVVSNNQTLAVANELAFLEELLQEQSGRIIELYAMNEAMQQAGQDYRSILAAGLRIEEDRKRFEQRTAQDVQEFRHQDFSFRVFRNDALQKYRAQFDLAARYVYLAAKAYDFETNLQPENQHSARSILTDVVRARSLGTISGGVPQTGGVGDPGLADPMARMDIKFTSLEPDLGFNNPNVQIDRFSLRREFFRTQTNDFSVQNRIWAETLRRHVVPDIQDLPEYKRFCVPITPAQADEPGIVIPFSTEINAGRNFFGWPAGGADHIYLDTQNSIKIREVGVHFINYNSQVLIATPAAFLIPAGADILRSPVLSRETREWKILDQIVPVPHLGSENFTLPMSDPDFSPIVHSMGGSFIDVRRYADRPAIHTGNVELQLTNNSQHIGRSVWNTRWVLIIPAVRLNSDRELGLDLFIEGTSPNPNFPNGVSDIQLIFRSYQYAGIISN